MVKMGTRTLAVGSVVQHIDGQGNGTIIRFTGQKSVGGGLHARILWENGGSSVVRLDLLLKV